MLYVGSCLIRRVILRHQQILGERPYQCDVCKKSLSSMRVLKTHQYINTGKHPYNCDVCKVSFIIKIIW